MKKDVAKPILTRFRTLYEQTMLPIGRACVRVGLTPDMLTALSLVLGGLAAFLISRAAFLPGILFIGLMTLAGIGLGAIIAVPAGLFLAHRAMRPIDAAFARQRAFVADARPGRFPSFVVAPVFPAYFVCEQVEVVTVDGKPARRRRLVRWQDLDPRGGRRKFVFDDGKKSDVTPIRFVCACEKGHLQDISWKWVVHGIDPCQEPMWIEEKGTSADENQVSRTSGSRVSGLPAFSTASFSVRAT